MINWDNINYPSSEAEKDFMEIEVSTKAIEPIFLNDSFYELRRKLLEARDRIYDENNLDSANKLDYEFDLNFGLELYEVLGNEIEFENRAATNDDVWRYLSIKVIPDIVHARWGKNADHFYKIPRRIWLKTIWWYIHLSWYEDKETTYDLLKNNSTDTILQLVERPSLGYYIELYREIMKQYDEKGKNDRNLFRRLLKLNTARIVSISPELVDGGIIRYVADLFEEAKE